MVIFYVDNGIVLVSGYKEDRDLFISKIHELFVSSNVQNKPKVTVNGLIGYLQSQPGLLKCFGTCFGLVEKLRLVQSCITTPTANSPDDPVCCIFLCNNPSTMVLEGKNYCQSHCMAQFQCAQPGCESDLYGEDGYCQIHATSNQ